jgi:hypothetical protein
MRLAFLAAFLFTPLIGFASSEKPLIIHEWGTFTSLQDEAGRSIGGVNVDDEPVPEFVHRLGNRQSVFDGSKSLYPGSPSVTMRLETPVIYFYPSDDKPISLDITATFNGGFVSEFFPNGETFLNGKPYRRSPESIAKNARAGITWKNVTLNTPTTKPSTDAHVWLAPRKVASTPVKIGGEGEQYIFYRGVGNLDAPLKVTRAGNGESITIANHAPEKHDLAKARMWLADFRPDGTSAFREFQLGKHSASFDAPEYASDNIAKLRTSMKRALVADGLFDDEAEAMLETWKLSYFKSGGQRLFFLVPRQWTDEVLPLEVSKPAKLTRVMMGRIELVTPQQRVVINQFADAKTKLDKATAERLLASLGRFGQPLLNDDARRRQADRAAVATPPSPVAVK